MVPNIDPRPLHQLASSIASLCSGKYSDFSIRCADRTIIRAHRAVVCPRSRVIAAALDGNFKEAIAQEIDMEDDEPSIVGKMVDFLYKLDYDDQRAAPKIRQAPKTNYGAYLTPSQIGDQYQIDDEDQHMIVNPLSLLINAKVYIIADKYQIQALKDLAAAKYKDVLPDTWNSPEFTESALKIYNNTVEMDRMLRDVIVEESSKNVKTLLDRGEFVDLLKSQSDLSVEVLQRVVSTPVPARIWDPLPAEDAGDVSDSWD